MSAEEEVAAADICCASCGKAEIDDIKLKKCDGDCDLVKYCSDVCLENNRDQHEEECRKRKAGLRDKDLFTQPDISHMGECPICCLPQPIDPTKSAFMTCCSQLLCKGCGYGNQLREIEAGLKPRCAFCREPLSKSEEETDKRCTKRIKKNDPAAMLQMGKRRHVEGDYDGAFQYWKRAAELGDANAHFNLSGLYDEGLGVEKDKKKEVYHLEEAAIAGHPKARFCLGIHELKNGSFERARKHFIIGANLACEDSLKGLKEIYTTGFASKEDYAGALRGYQAALEATKSSEREEAEHIVKIFREAEDIKTGK